VKGLLPNLQANLPQLPRNGLLTHEDAFWMKMKTGERIPCDIRWNTRSDWPTKPLPKDPNQVQALVVQALEDWFG
jgi:hypothetical protein